MTTIEVSICYLFQVQSSQEWPSVESTTKSTNKSEKSKAALVKEQIPQNRSSYFLISEINQQTSSHPCTLTSQTMRKLLILYIKKASVKFHTSWVDAMDLDVFSIIIISLNPSQRITFVIPGIRHFTRCSDVLLDSQPTVSKHSMTRHRTTVRQNWTRLRYRLNRTADLLQISQLTNFPVRNGAKTSDVFCH